MSSAELPFADTAARTDTGIAIALELRLLDPEVRADRDEVESLLADDFTELGASGQLWTRSTMLDVIGAFRYDPPEVLGIEARELAPDLVLVTYITERDGDRVYRSSVWRHRDSAWQVVHHQATPLPR